MFFAKLRGPEPVILREELDRVLHAQVTGIDATMARGVIREAVIDLETLGGILQARDLEQYFTRLRVLTWNGERTIGSVSILLDDREQGSYILLEDVERIIEAADFLVSAHGASAQDSPPEIRMLKIPEPYFTVVALKADDFFRFTVVDPPIDSLQNIPFDELREAALSNRVTNWSPG